MWTWIWQPSPRPRPWPSSSTTDGEQPPALNAAVQGHAFEDLLLSRDLSRHLWNCALGSGDIFIYGYVDEKHAAETGDEI